MAHAPGVQILLIIDSTYNEGPKYRMIAATYNTDEKHVANEYGLFKTWASHILQARETEFIDFPATCRRLLWQ